MSYQVGEVVLLEHEGWLKAFVVVGARQISENEIEYRLQLEGSSWQKPKYG